MKRADRRLQIAQLVGNIKATLHGAPEPSADIQADLEIIDGMIGHDPEIRGRMRAARALFDLFARELTAVLDEIEGTGGIPGGPF